MSLPKIVVFVIIIFLAVGLVFSLSLWARPQGENTNAASIVTTNTAERIINVSVTPGELSLVTESGRKMPYVDLPDVYADHVHPAELHDGTIYVIRRRGQVGVNATGTDELWKIDAQKNMAKLYSHPGFEFRVSPDQRWTAINNAGDEQPTLVLLDLRTRETRNFTVDDLTGAASQTKDIAFDGWSTGNTVWGHSAHAEQPKFFSLQASTDSIQTYAFPVDMSTLSSDFALNLKTGQLAYSTYPRFFDNESATVFEQAGTEVTLYTYNFVTKNLMTVATSQGREFKPTWLSADQLEYTNPADGQRETATISQ